VTYFIAGDATYAEVLLKERVVDGLAGDMRAYRNTVDRITAFARSEPTVLLPSHDPLAGHRLAERIPLTERAGNSPVSCGSPRRCSRRIGGLHLVTRSRERNYHEYRP
jgi:glyoxylase-like metal-dependent hydrolase (beta-lactamase superfamily II)